MNVIELRNVSKEFNGSKSVVALSDVSFEVAAGEMVSIMGPSGSGKSTLLNIMGGLDQPTRGTVKLGGADLTALSDQELTRVRREQIGFVFQFFNLISTLTAFENVALPMFLAGRTRREVRARVTELLGAVGLADRETHLPEELSGGEQQRVAIARALVLEPQVILADEPTGNLDSRNGEEILNLLKSLHDRLRATIVLVTHDPRAAGYCSRRILMKDGRIESQEYS